MLLDEREHVYLADFGSQPLSRRRSASLGPAKSLGTADYVAPEQIRGEEVDGRADVYSLGCLLYECLAGPAAVRRATDSAMLFAQLEDVPPAAPGLEKVLPKALAKEPATATPTCGELIQAARSALGPRGSKRAGWPIAVAAAGGLVGAAALLAFFLTRAGSGAAADSDRRLAHQDRSCDQHGGADDSGWSQGERGRRRGSLCVGDERGR